MLRTRLLRVNATGEERDDASYAVKQSAEFRELGPSSSVAMVKHLSGVN
ncbi:MAG: hypothetical protein ACYC28_07335 [Longimicrobiales bacterium]